MRIIFLFKLQEPRQFTRRIPRVWTLVAVGIVDVDFGVGGAAPGLEDASGFGTDFGGYVGVVGGGEADVEVARWEIVNIQMSPM